MCACLRIHCTTFATLLIATPSPVPHADAQLSNALQALAFSLAFFRARYCRALVNSLACIRVFFVDPNVCHRPD